jgi:hypothetical protein
MGPAAIKRATSKAAFGGLLSLMLLSIAHGQVCAAGDDMGASKASMEAAARKYFDLAARGDSEGLRSSAIPSVAQSFSGIAAAVQDNQAGLSKGQPTVKSSYLLTAEGSQPLERAEFLCGVFGKTGQTASSAVIIFNGLPPGKYGLVILDVAADAKAPERYAVAFVLEEINGEWKLGGFYAKSVVSAGHGSNWFAEQARAFAAKGQKLNAWFYFLEARNLATLVPFLSTRETDRLYDEQQKVVLPGAVEGFPPEVEGGGQVYKIKSAYAYSVAGELNLVVKYEYPDVTDTAKAYAQNQAVVRALAGKWPELREGFSAIVARATEPSGKDFGTLLVLKDLR